jgi:uncharacterized protein YndB with AHSA1/START domain
MAAASTAANSIHFEAEGLISAPATTVWDILTDYRNGHPRILPSAFSNFTVESGGNGAGTIISYTFRAAGTSRRIRHNVSETDPGHILVEDAPGDPTRTTFTLTPAGDGAHTRLVIATDQTTPHGLRGVITRLLAPLAAPIIRAIYRDEMQRLDDLAQRWPADANS